MSLLRRRMMMQQQEEGENVREWKLLADITLEEDLREFDVFSGLDLEELYVYTTATNIESQTVATQMGLEINGIRHGAVGTTAPASIVCGLFGENGRNWIHVKALNPYIVEHGEWTKTNTISQKGKHCWQPNLHEYENPYAVNERINSLKITKGMSTSYFATGSRFIVYGR